MRGLGRVSLLDSLEDVGESSHKLHRLLGNLPIGGVIDTQHTLIPDRLTMRCGRQLDWGTVSMQDRLSLSTNYRTASASWRRMLNPSSTPLHLPTDEYCHLR